MNLVITGASGYIASALRTLLQREPYRLKLVSRTGDVGLLSDNESVVQSSLDSVESWVDLIKDADFVIHLSALTNLSITESDVEASWNENVVPVEQLIEAARRIGRPELGVAFASTVTVVGLEHENPVSEDTALNPITNYDRHKVTCEELLYKATQDGLLRACSLRLANVYGFMGRGASNNRNRGVINMMERRALDGEPLSVYGDGHYLRDFVHISDVVQAFLSVVGVPKALDGGAYIVATGAGVSLKDAFQIIASSAEEHTGRAVEIHKAVLTEPLRPIETRNFIGDSSKLQRTTNWHPKLSFNDGVRLDLDFLTSS